MRITRLYLRNYRVYEDELTLEMPPGLVGIYGPNGAGKSALLESIRWTLFGKARTDIAEIRTAGLTEECITECEFEHEGHLYVVRRTIKGGGKNLTVKAEAQADGQQVAEGARDTARYVHSILGMDDGPFRASVFAEQKQIDAFTDQTPGNRKKLVLQLLGITPLDTAHAAAKKDAKDRQTEYEKLRDLLPDPETLRVAVDDLLATSAARANDAADEATALATAESTAAEAEKRFRHLDEVRQEYDLIVQDGKAARAQLDDLATDIAQREKDQQDLAAVAQQLAALEPIAAALDVLEARLRSVEQVEVAAASLARHPEPVAPEPVNEDMAERARSAADLAATTLAELGGRLTGATTQLEAARVSVDRADDLSDAAACPMCGQELGAAFEQVQAHRAEELHTAQTLVTALTGERKAAATAATAAQKAAKDADAALRVARARWQEHETVLAARREAQRGYDTAVAALDAPPADGEAPELRSRVAQARNAAEECATLRGRLARRDANASELDTKRELLGQVTGKVETLRDKLKALGHDAAALTAAAQTAETTATAAAVAARRNQAAQMEAATAKAKAEAERNVLAQVEAQHAQLAELKDDARYLVRLSDMLQQFRNGVVAKVGPMLEQQAGALFAELTDHEYDGFEVDPESYEIKLQDGAGVYGMRRFSGSETDLANLALRVAISEQVRLQSGGAVGLLVLDEVFGPLDDDRKDLMLYALERLTARFRQVLVVSHDADIKERLPNAIEVVKLPGRRATARVV